MSVSVCVRACVCVYVCVQYTAVSRKVVMVNSRYWNRKELWVTVIIIENALTKFVTVWLWHDMMNLHSYITVCKVNANSNKLLELLEPHSSFWFKYRLLTMTSFFELTVSINTYISMLYLYLLYSFIFNSY